MLQQTQVATVIPYYERFLDLFPDVESLAGAPLDDVLKAWENLGYYARARNLHLAAQQVVRQHQGRIPDNWDDLIQLPGVGPYMAGAILSMAFNRRVPAADGNVRRIIARVLAVEECIDERPVQKRLDAVAAELVPEDRPGDFNQALMDIGAGICTPRHPACSDCPLAACCRGYEKDLQNVLPIRKKKGPVPHHQAVAGIIADSKGRLLIAKRPEQGLLGGLWKWPGGMKAEGESLVDCLRRTIREELGILVDPGDFTLTVKHQYTHFRITIHACSCTIVSGRPTSLTCAEFAWAGPEERKHYAFSKADRKIESKL